MDFQVIKITSKFDFITFQIVKNVLGGSAPEPPIYILTHPFPHFQCQMFARFDCRSRWGLLTRKCVCCACSIWVIYGFKRAKIQYFQPKLAIFAIFTFKNGAFKHTSDWAHGEVSNSLFGLQSSHPRSFSAIACVENRKRAIFDCQKNL